MSDYIEFKDNTVNNCINNNSSNFNDLINKKLIINLKMVYELVV